MMTVSNMPSGSQTEVWEPEGCHNSEDLER
jgi:hypothetical protein